MDDLDQSLDAESEWIYMKKSMQESLVATSQKVYFQNASVVNRAELEKSKKQLRAVAEQPLEDTQNQFLEVGKWRKNKESTLTQEMASVKNEVQQNMTNTRWKQQQQKEEKEKQEVIADESICPDQDEKQEEEEPIEDQTQQEDQEEQEEQEEEQEEQEEQEEEEEEQQEEEEEQEESQQQPSHAPSKGRESDEDDKTDTQSEMKRTEYLPSKWTKKRDSQGPNNSSPSSNPWQRKQAILKRILILIK